MNIFTFRYHRLANFLKDKIRDTPSIMSDIIKNKQTTIVGKPGISVNDEHKCTRHLEF